MSKADPLLYVEYDHDYHFYDALSDTFDYYHDDSYSLV